MAYILCNFNHNKRVILTSNMNEMNKVIKIEIRFYVSYQRAASNFTNSG